MIPGFALLSSPFPHPLKKYKPVLPIVTGHNLNLNSGPSGAESKNSLNRESKNSLNRYKNKYLEGLENHRTLKKLENLTVSFYSKLCLSLMNKQHFPYGEPGFLPSH